MATDPLDETEAAIEEQQRDADDVSGGFQVGVVTGSQARGVALWGLVGVVAGALLGVLIGLIPIADLPIGARMGIWALVGALAGGTAGAVYGGGREPEVEGEV